MPETPPVTRPEVSNIIFTANPIKNAPIVNNRYLITLFILFPHYFSFNIIGNIIVLYY